ncbi:MAG: DUF4252 domain-containing protein [Bacteroidales bacterium]|nr:DUF4252 domain-containing protein [Bacteroidales bacterium]
MKRIIAYIMLLLMCGSTAIMAQNSSDSELKLRDGSRLREVDYTYISPWMLKSMKQKDLMEFADIPLDKLKHIEILKTQSQGMNSAFSHIVNKLSDEPGFKLVGYNRDGDKGVKICVDSKKKADSPEGDEEEIRRILMIQWAYYGSQHTAVYIVGNFTRDDVSSLFHF